MVKQRKALTGEDVDKIIQYKFNTMTTTPYMKARISNARIGKLLGMSGEKVRKLYLARMVEL